VALKDENNVVRRYAVEALGNIGPAAKDAIRAVEAAEDDEDSEVRIAARAALKKLQQKGS
jgi:HEAT repeat protein